MANPLPILFLGGGALLLMTGKKKKKPSAKKRAEPRQTFKPLPQADEDLDEEEEEPVAPTPGPDEPFVEPSLEPPEEPPAPGPEQPEGPYGKPAIGPSGVGSCANAVYTRDPQYFTPDASVSQKALNLFDEPGYYFYIRRDFQAKLYDYMYQRFSAMQNNQERR